MLYLKVLCNKELPSEHIKYVIAPISAEQSA